MPMSKPRSKTATAELRIPLQVKPREETREKLKKLAEANGLSLNDIATMCLASGLPMVEKKLREIHEPAEQAA